MTFNAEMIAGRILQHCATRPTTEHVLETVSALEMVMLVVPLLDTCPKCGATAWVNIDCDLCAVCSVVLQMRDGEVERDPVNGQRVSAHAGSSPGSVSVDESPLAAWLACIVEASHGGDVPKTVRTLARRALDGEAASPYALNVLRAYRARVPFRGGTGDKSGPGSSPAGSVGASDGQRTETALPDAWKDEDDKPLPEDPQIKAAFPTRSGRHDLYGEAMRLAGARYSKSGLVALVNWLLHRNELAQSGVCEPPTCVAGKTTSLARDVAALQKRLVARVTTEQIGVDRSAPGSLAISRYLGRREAFEDAIEMLDDETAPETGGTDGDGRATPE